MTETTESYRHLGPFSDWPAAARADHPLYPAALPGAATRERVRAVLNFGANDAQPADVRTDARWERDGVTGEAVSWSVGYGPRTEAWMLTPTGATGPLPGVVALHDHGGFKWYGKEKIADGPDDPAPFLQAFRERYYGGRAYANAMARAGFAVLVPDTFLWGSRRFPMAAMPETIHALVAASRSLWAPTVDAGLPEEIAAYHAAAGHHEHWIERYCTVLGITLAGVVAHEDRVALAYLRARAEVDAARVGCIGLSGGGNRAALLAATADHLTATAIVGLMSTYAALLDHNMAHTWMFFPHGWAREGDWPDLAASRAPTPLLVQYDRDDSLFTPEGMQAAHETLAARYTAAGAPDAYTGQFYPGSHKFDLPMQTAAFAWLTQTLND